MLIDTNFASAPLLKRMFQHLTAPNKTESPYANAFVFQESVNSLSGVPFARLLAQIEHVPHVTLAQSQKPGESKVPVRLLRNEMSGLFMGLAERCDTLKDPEIFIAHACGTAALLAAPKDWRENWAVEVCVWTLHDLAIRLEKPAQAKEAAALLADHAPDGHALVPFLKRFETLAPEP